MSNLDEVLHSAKQMVNEHRHAYPPAWRDDATEIITQAASELAELRAENEKLKTDFVQMTHNCVGAEMEADALRAVVEAAREAEQAINKAGITLSGDAWNKLSKLAAALARVDGEK